MDEERVYKRALSVLNSETTEKAYLAGAEMFSSILEYKDAAQLKIQCMKKAETARKDSVYETAKNYLKKATRDDLHTALKLLETIPDWRDVESLTQSCREQIDAQEAEAAARQKRRKKRFIAVVAVLVGICVAVAMIPVIKYHKAIQLAKEGQYREALLLLEQIKVFGNSEKLIKEMWQKEGEEQMQKGNYAEAGLAFEKAEDPRSREMWQKEGEELMEEGETAKAAIALGKAGDSRTWDLWDQIAVRDTLTANRECVVAIKTDGTVIAVKNKCGVVAGSGLVTDWTDIVAVSSRLRHTVGLKSDGTCVATGSNEYGQSDVSNWTDIVAVSAGCFHTIGLRSDGTCVATGSNEYGQSDVSNWTDIIAISAGDYHTVGLRADGTCVAVGAQEGNVFFDVSDWTDIVAIRAGTYSTVGVKSDGTVVATTIVPSSKLMYKNPNIEANMPAFKESASQVSDWTGIVAVTTDDIDIYGLKADGTVVGTSGRMAFDDLAANFNDDCSAWTDIVATCATFDGIAGLKADGTVVWSIERYNDGTECKDTAEGMENVDRLIDIKIP